jgi:hypothetical protein
MRRSMLKLMMVGTVVLGAAVPALTAGARFVGDQLVSATSSTTDQLVVTTTTTDLTGILIDGACYLSKGAKATSDHAACALVCAQKGGRLALLTPLGGLYQVIGVLTQNNNANLIPFVNKVVVLTGILGTRVQDASTLTPSVTTDGRRSNTSQTEIIEKVTFRVGDFREGDIPLGSELTIDASSIKLATTK